MSSNPSELLLEFLRAKNQESLYSCKLKQELRYSCVPEDLGYWESLNVRTIEDYEALIKLEGNFQLLWKRVYGPTALIPNWTRQEMKDWVSRYKNDN